MEASPSPSLSKSSERGSRRFSWFSRSKSSNSAKLKIPWFGPKKSKSADHIATAHLNKKPIDAHHKHDGAPGTRDHSLPALENVPVTVPSLSLPQVPEREQVGLSLPVPEIVVSHSHPPPLHQTLPNPTFNASPDPPSPSESLINLDGTEFTVGKILTYGSACDIYMGSHPIHGEVALKRPRVDANSVVSEVLRRFRREAAIWKRVSEAHSNILPILGVFSREDHLYLVSAYMRNGDAMAALNTPTIDKFRLLTGIACALTYLHEEGIVHGDVKSKNVLIGEDGEPLICDFGIAKIVVEGMVTSTNIKGIGTLRYMAPELFEDDSSKTAASDVYSFGMTIVEILTGKQPYDHIKSTGALISRIALGRGHPSGDPSHSPRGESYEDLWTLSERCCQLDATLRPTMAQVHSDLLAIGGRRVNNGLIPGTS